MDGGNNWDNLDDADIPDWQNTRTTRPISRGSRASRTSSVNTRDGNISEDESFHDTLENFNIQGNTGTEESADFRINEFIGETDPMMSGNENFDNLPSPSDFFAGLSMDMDDSRIGQDVPEDHPLMRTLTQGDQDAMEHRAVGQDMSVDHPLMRTLTHGDQDAMEDRAGPSTQHSATTSAMDPNNSYLSDLDFLTSSKVYKSDVIDYNTYLNPKAAETDIGPMELPFDFRPHQEVEQTFDRVPRYSVDSESSHDHSRPSSVASQYSEISYASRKRSLSTVATDGDGCGTKRGRPPKYFKKGLPSEAVATAQEDPKKALDRERNNQAVKTSRENSKKQQIRTLNAFNDIVTNFEEVCRNRHNYSRESFHVVCQIFVGLTKDDVNKLRESLSKLESPNKKSKKGDQPGPSSGP